MYVLGSEIRIREFLFRRVNSVEIDQDSRKIGDFCTIKIPTTGRIQREETVVSEVETVKVFQTGDEVLVKLGYNGELQEEFRGFVRSIKPTIPLEIECEDEIYLLKRKNLKASFKNTTLKELLEFIVADTGIKLVDNIPAVSFTHFYFKNTSAAKALQKIRDEYGLTIYFSEWKKLFVGITNGNDGKVVKYDYSINVNDTDLEWVDEKDVSLEIKAINLKPDNTQFSVKVGDPDGEKRTLFFYDLKSEADLKKKASEEVEKYRYTGYRGSLTSFLVPIIGVGNVASVRDGDFPDRSGEYLVEKVKTTYDESGVRRKITLGIKVDL